MVIPGKKETKRKIIEEIGYTAESNEIDFRSPRIKCKRRRQLSSGKKRKKVCRILLTFGKEPNNLALL